jgi:uncharacterized protein (TIGR02186 family)
MKPFWLIALIFAVGWALWPHPARADYLVADLSKRRIDITLGFSGADVLLFGATDSGGDVVVVVRGPEQKVTVRRKERVLGLWVNREWVTYEQTPAFYYVASSKPLESVATDGTLAGIEVGLDHIRLKPADSSEGADTRPFRDALIRAKQREGLYGGTGQVSFIGGRLFRTTVSFPATVATGPYTVEVFLLRDGKVETAQRWPLFVTKVGMSAAVVERAHLTPIIYGLVAVFIAVVAGWLGAIGLRKV